MSVKLNLMPGESLNGFFIRDALVNGRFGEVRDGAYWAYGFLSAFRLFTSVGGQIFKRYSKAFSELDQAGLESSHTLLPLYRPVEKTYPLIDRSTFNLNSKREFPSEKKTVSPLVCPQCYREQVAEYGFYWLRIEWQNPYAPYCFTHDCTLVGYAPIFYEHFPAFLSGKQKDKYHSESIEEHLSLAGQLSDRTLELYRWFYDLFVYNLPNLDIRRQQAIIARAYCRIYGAKFSSREELVEGLARAFNLFACERDSAASASGSAYKWFYHPHYDQRYIKRFIDGSNIGISSPHYWTLVYLAYRNFDVFMERCGDIFTNLDTPVLIDL